MSHESERPQGLSFWISELVQQADADPSGAGTRLRGLVEGMRARIRLDEDTVLVEMSAGRLHITPDECDARVDGEGATTSAVVVAILDGALEVQDALSSAMIEVRGRPDAVSRLFHVVEILLDAATRVPELRRLADRFVVHAGGSSPLLHPARPGGQTEADLLQRLGLGNGT